MLGRGLGELLHPAKSEKNAPTPDRSPGGGGSEGGVTTLLRGKREENRFASRLAPGILPSSEAKPRSLVVLSLAAADGGLVMAGGMIAWQNPFASAPWHFCFGLGLVGLGGWLGYLAWRSSRSS